jgi:hypothetical protein
VKKKKGIIRIKIQKGFRNNNPNKVADAYIIQKIQPKTTFNIRIS